ncbi:RING finger protein [Endozoicomonas sp. SESOKO3]|uniref:RING finger protein n=2 Tax=unclassified Endozoicomonas TaxID=2644528 RepID=UPI0021487209|nr:RING finger protein [Endozoicomonas sp. SESOKO3]
MRAGESMTPEYFFKTLLFSVCLFFYQQGLANDTYGLEEFRQYQMANWKPLSKKQQSSTSQPGMCLVENIRIGFVRLNLETDNAYGDGRLETCEDYQVAQQDFNRLNDLYFNYVNMGDPQHRKNRIKRMLRLMHRIFAININITNGKNQEEHVLINSKALSLFENLFLSVNRNGSRNPYFNYFYTAPEAPECNYIRVNKDLVLMFLAFLGPHFLTRHEIYISFKVLSGRYIGKICARACDRALLSENINEYNSPQSLANQLSAAGLDAETALLIGLAAMASAAFQRMNSGQESQETLETLLIRCLPYEFLSTIHDRMSCHCHTQRSHETPRAIYTDDGMREFTHSIVGIDPTPVLPVASSLVSLEYLVFNDQDSDSENSFGAPDSGNHDQSIVVQQQNELIAQLRQELASRPATEEAGAVGGASGGTKKCPICFKPIEDIMVLQGCGHAGLCEGCAGRIIDEQKNCPFCREATFSYMKVIDKSFY